MKRKLVVEEYGQHAISKAKSGWNNLMNLFSPRQEKNADFYPLCDKKHFFENSNTFKTVAFSNGVLFGGCMMYTCVESCLPIEYFTPSDERDTQLFNSYINVHRSAVACGDLLMASEYRKLIEDTRSDICINCKNTRNTRNTNRSTHSIDEPPTEEPATDDPPTDEPSTDEPSTDEPSTDEPSIEEPSIEEPATEEPATEEPALKNSPGLAVTADAFL